MTRHAVCNTGRVSLQRGRVVTSRPWLNDRHLTWYWLNSTTLTVQTKTNYRQKHLLMLLTCNWTGEEAQCVFVVNPLDVKASLSAHSQTVSCFFFSKAMSREFHFYISWHVIFIRSQRQSLKNCSYIILHYVLLYYIDKWKIYYSFKKLQFSRANIDFKYIFQRPMLKMSKYCTYW